jgi:glycine/D-amino acid oxidase-like deaminating enzyme
MLDRPLDLRSGQTVWRRIHGPPKLYPPLQHDIRCEVAIVGGGITGALIAHELIESGVNCVMIDKGEIGGGSTSASTALLLYELDTPLAELAGMIGEADAAACYRACLDSLTDIAQLVSKLGLTCNHTPKTSYYLADTAQQAAQLEEECSLRRKHGMSVELLRREDIEERFSFSAPAALCSKDAAEIDAVAFVNALIESAESAGLRVHGSTLMTEYRTTPSGVSLRTSAGCEIAARNAVFATGYESERYLGRKIGSLKSTYAIATKPIAHFDGWYERSLIWTTARPYYYLRTTNDRRAVIGGADVEFHDELARDALLQEKTAELASALRRFFPDLNFEVDCAWTGTFGETKDSLACIGMTDDMPGAFFALGYGGNGLSYGAVAANIIGDLYLGNPNQVARLFRFGR